MDENLKYYLKTQFFRGYSAEVNSDIGKIKSPKLCKLKDDLIYYIYLFNKFIDLYEKNKNSFYTNLFIDREIYEEFASLISYVTDCKEVKLVKDRFIYNINNFISFDNYSIFMDVIVIMHHCDEIKTYKLTDAARKYLEEAKRRKEEMEKRIKLKGKIKQKNGIGFLEIMSTVCARHPSINPIIINKLNYFQIIEQYKRLLKIDDYTVTMNALSSGNLDTKKQKQIKHYTE
jgi:hypothetical protein